MFLYLLTFFLGFEGGLPLKEESGVTSRFICGCLNKLSGSDFSSFSCLVDPTGNFFKNAKGFFNRKYGDRSIFLNRMFGITWKVNQLKVYEPQRLKGFHFQLEEDEPDF